MAQKRAFLVPVVIDATPERGASVPEKFHDLQWTRLPNGDTPPAFVERIQHLLSVESAATVRSPATAASVALGSPQALVQASRASRRGLLVAVAVALLGAGAYFAVEKPWISKQAISSPTVAPAAFNPPPHSIAVLPFVNMSGDKEQEYFSDGLTEELLNSLAGTNQFQVAARTSAFSFKGKDTDIGTIARKLNVGTVLEGSVRRSGNTVRIAVQLFNAETGFDLWSHTYDRDLTDMLKVQTEIANAVASALKVRLLSDADKKIELGGTRNPAALDAYLRGRTMYTTRISDAEAYQREIAAYTEAIGLDPNFALAFADRSRAQIGYYLLSSGPADDLDEKAKSDALRAIALAPELAEGHLALANYFESRLLDFTQANAAYERALALAPGNARVLRDYSTFAVLMGRPEAGIAAAQHAVALDPLSPDTKLSLGDAFYYGGHYKEAVETYRDAIALDPDSPQAYVSLGLGYYAQGDFQRARASCETKRDSLLTQPCLAMTYDKLGRHADAESVLAKYQTRTTNDWEVEYAFVYAQWGNTGQALRWLEAAVRSHNPILEFLKVDPLLAPLRHEPRFQAIERGLKFPN
jgi:TolB-like protein/Tfp pilus assembly protein PilF